MPSPIARLPAERLLRNAAAKVLKPYAQLGLALESIEAERGACKVALVWGDARLERMLADEDVHHGRWSPPAVPAEMLVLRMVDDMLAEFGLCRVREIEPEAGAVLAGLLLGEG